MSLSRRGFIGGLAAALAAPVIIRSGILMPIKPALIVEPIFEYVYPTGPYTTLSMELAAITRKVFMPNLYSEIYKKNAFMQELLAGPQLPKGIAKADPVLWAANFGQVAPGVEGDYVDLIKGRPKKIWEG
jgi:hypothetical protein